MLSTEGFFFFFFHFQQDAVGAYIGASRKIEFLKFFMCIMDVRVVQ